MTTELGVRDVTGRAVVRAVPPKRWARLVVDSTARDGLDGPAAERAVADGLLHHLVKPAAPALLLSYLSAALASGIVTARTFALSLLAHLHRAEGTSVVDTPQLASIAGTLLANPTDLGPGEYLPSPVSLSSLADVPDVGTSASAAADEVPALSLLMPLLRLCANAPAPVPLLALAARLAAFIPPLPAPPFDVGLEAAQLSGSLPEDVATPLRECLAGLMADLPLPAAAPGPPAITLFDGPLAGPNGSSFGDLGASLAPLGGPLSLPLPQAVAFLIEYAHRAHGWVRNSQYATSPPTPPMHLIQLIRLGRALTADSQEFLAALLDAAITRVISSWSHGPFAAVRPFSFFTDELPVLLRWWRDNSDPKWPFPQNLQGALGDVFAAHSSQLANTYQALNSIYTAKFSQSEPDDEAGPYVQPDGWSMLSIEATAVRRYVSLGLLDDEATIALTGSAVKATQNGESLLERLATSSQSHLAALEFFIPYAAGATHAFGSELAKCIANIAQQPPPENLFIRLAGSPSLLGLVSAYIMPMTLLDLLTTHLLDRAEDEVMRAEDPQGSLIRFGAGVVLVEAICAQFELPLPDLLYDARRATNLADLPEVELNHLNGWIKALFGSDGIDDEIVMTTSPQNLCRFSSTIVQQSVVAAMSGQIDLDTLHSGLSYYAQPLLSWCLGSVVGWLCAEIERQGLLSGMHLNVLQTLVLDSSFPEPLLRVNAKAINHLLEQTTGLQQVLQSSNFDHVAVRARLQAVGSADGGVLMPETPRSPPLPTLRSELQAVRHLDLAAPGWVERLLDALRSSLSTHGGLKTVEAVLTDILYPTLTDVEGTNSDPLVQFLALISILPIPRVSPVPIAFTIVDAYLPSLFGPRSILIPPLPPLNPFVVNMAGQPNETLPPPPIEVAARALHRLLRLALFAADAESDAIANTLASHLADELAFQRARPDAGSKRKRVTKGPGSGEPPMSADLREMLNQLSAAFEADDEVKARWPALGA